MNKLQLYAKCRPQLTHYELCRLFEKRYKFRLRASVEFSAKASNQLSHAIIIFIFIASLLCYRLFAGVLSFSKFNESEPYSTGA